jgi:hypothetical protein
MKTRNRMKWLLEIACLASTGLYFGGCAAEADDPQVATVQENVTVGIPIIDDAINWLLPAKVRDAAYAVRDCKDELVMCVGDSARPSAVTACNEDYANCVADVLGVDLPDVPVEEVVSCAEEAVECTLSAYNLRDLAACTTGLTGCAVEATHVIDIIHSVNECTTATASCVIKARRPSALARCGEAEVDCIAGTLDINLPDIPLSEATACAEQAVVCTGHSHRLSDITACTGQLVSCAGETIEAVPVIDCATVFSTCLLANPLRFLQCAQESQSCLSKTVK